MADEEILDKILVHIGDFKKSQIVIFSLVCICVVLHSETHIAFVFTAMDSNYRCRIEGCDSSSESYTTPWTKNAIPYTNGKPEKCEMYVLENLGENCTGFNQKLTKKCDSYVFEDNEDYIGREFNILCKENLWKLTLVGTINNIGQFFGLIFAGIMSDKFGRRIALLGGLIMAGVFGVIKTFSPSYNWFIILELIESFMGAGVYTCGFIIGVELVGPKNRVLTGTIVCSCYALGEILTGVFAYWLRSWKKLIYIIYIPCIFLIFFFLWLPESIRWNLSKGKIEKSKRQLVKIAKGNGRTIPEELLKKLDLFKDDSIPLPEHRLSSIMTSKLLLVRFLSLCYCWITCAFLFYGITLTSVYISGNSYLDFIVISITELPAYWVCTYVVEKYGRRYSQCISFVITTVACVFFILIPPEGSQWLNLFAYCLGKFGATAAFTIVYVITSEVFPTPLRHSVMGACSTIGRL